MKKLLFFERALTPAEKEAIEVRAILQNMHEGIKDIADILGVEL